MNSLAICGNLLNTKIQTDTVTDDLTENLEHHQKWGNGQGFLSGVRVGCPVLTGHWIAISYRDGHFHQVRNSKTGFYQNSTWFLW